MATVNAVYRDGAFHPEVPVELPEGASVRLSVEPDRPQPPSPLVGPELLALISKSWPKLNSATDRPEVTSENVDKILYGSGGRGGSGDVR